MRTCNAKSIEGRSQHLDCTRAYYCTSLLDTETRWLISVHWWNEGTLYEGTCRRRFSRLPALLQRKGGESPSRRVSSCSGALSQRRGCLPVTGCWRSGSWSATIEPAQKRCSTPRIMKPATPTRHLPDRPGNSTYLRVRERTLLLTGG